MTAARGLAIGALVVAVVVVAVLLLGGSNAHEYTLKFQNAGQLVKDNDVQIGGRRIGRVADIRLTDDNQAEVDIEVEEPYAPLHEGTTAIIRATSLSGIANRYISLNPGPNDADELDDGTVLDASKTTTPVDLDQLFNTLDPKTRKALQDVIQGSAQQYAGKGEKANEGIKYFNPALSTTSRLVNELIRDQQAFQDFIVYTAKTTTALAARRDDLSSLVSNANTTTAAIASENAALNEALGRLPGSLRKANTTFVNLRSTLDDLDKLVNASKPVAPKLAPFFRELRPLVRDAQPTLRDLRLLIQRPGTGNDLTDLLQKQPQLNKVALPTFKNSIQALRKGTPVVQFIRPYAPDLIGWFRDFGQSASNYDANGHFARIAPIFNSFQVTSDPVTGSQVLEPLTPAQRVTGLQTNKIKRCPGSAIQPAPDKSNPYRPDNLDCDPSVVLPGP
ncbi:MAG: MCE family protein [Solirubrobacterales bacterium]|nr:MCE family protein [Solirubrobacterales bacterium]